MVYILHRMFFNVNINFSVLIFFRPYKMDSDNDEWSDWSGCQDYLLDTQTDEVNIVNEDAGTAIPVDGSKTEDEPETVSAGESNNGNLHDQGLTANKIEVTITNQRETPSSDDVITERHTETPSSELEVSSLSFFNFPIISLIV